MNEIYCSLFFNEADALSKFPLELWSTPPVGRPRKTFWREFQNPFDPFFYRLLSSGVNGKVFAIEPLQLKGLGDLSDSRR
jgi:hypothetical protein